MFCLRPNIPKLDIYEVSRNLMEEHNRRMVKLFAVDFEAMITKPHEENAMCKTCDTKTTSDVPKGMKPFDLKKALAGAKVVTRDGQPVTNIRTNEYKMAIGSLPRNSSYVANEKGAQWENSTHPNDFFLVDEPELGAPQPFDLEAAKRGDALLWNTQPVYFVAHVPEARADDRLVLRTQGGRVVSMSQDGPGVRMAPKPVKKHMQRVLLKATMNNPEAHGYYVAAKEGSGDKALASVDVEFTIGQFAK